MLKKKIQLSGKANIPGIARRAILSWLLSVAIEYSILPADLRDLAGLEGLAQMSLPRMGAAAAGSFLLLTVTSHFARTDTIERWGIAAVFAVHALMALGASATWAFAGACLLLLVVLIGYGIFGWEKTPELLPAPKGAHMLCVLAAVGMSAAFFLFVSAWTVGRVYSFSTPSFDFGIFSQMFYYLKRTGLPMTTLERDGLMSHFAVHVSPVYYLMLPFYCLAPEAATLQVLQAAVITSAVVPLWKLGVRHGLTGAQRMLLCAVLFLYPSYSGGTSYDIHENCFLTPLILWIFYGIDRKNGILTGAAALLTLLVKEDAAVYVAVIGLWLTVRTVLRSGGRDVHDLLTGIALLTVALGWFFLVTGWLARNGDGVMTYRYDNFMYDGSSSLITVICAVIKEPMKAVYECVDPEKLQFLALTLLPLLGLPLLTRRYERYILLIPYILVDLMSDYQYQHDIFFQYTFGPTAFLMYLTVVDLADFKHSWLRSAALVLAVTVSAICFGKVVVPKAVHYPEQAMRHYEYYQDIRDTLDTIPDNASVAATTFYTTYLSQREILYDIRYCSREHLLEAEYVVIGLSAESDVRKYAAGDGENGFEGLVSLLEENGYAEDTVLQGVLAVYRKQ